MRRWRLPDGRTLVESPSFGDVQFYRLGRDHAIDWVYRKETRVLEGELHSLSYTVLDNQLMRRHTIDLGVRGSEDRSGVELAKLDLLLPGDEPTEKQVREAIAVHAHGEQAVDDAKRAKVDKIAANAAPALRDLVRRLAERVVFEDDDVARALLTSLGSLAAVRRSAAGAESSLQAATDALALAARLAALDPAARATEHPKLEESPALALIDSLETTRRELVARAAAGGTDAGAYREAAQVLRVAIYYLYTQVRTG